MRSKTTLLVFFLFSAVLGFSQQPAQYSLYMMNQLNWNPGYAGLEHSLSVTGGFREQWVGLEGGPSTQFISAHMPLYIARGGIGIHLENDEAGATKRTSSYISYNYQVFSEAGILSFGVSAGFVQFTLDGSRLRTPEGNYLEGVGGMVIDHQDELLPLGSINTMTNTFGAGVYFQSEKLELGIGVRHLNEPSLDLEGLSFPLKRAFFLNAGYNLEVNSSLMLMPSLMVQSDLVQTQTNVGLIAQYNENIFGGATYRGAHSAASQDAVAIIVGFKISENMKLGYAYDLTLSPLNNVSTGSHEIMINYNLNKRIGSGRPPRVIYNPRSL